MHVGSQLRQSVNEPIGSPVDGGHRFAIRLDAIADGCYRAVSRHPYHLLVRQSASVIAIKRAVYEATDSSKRATGIGGSFVPELKQSQDVEQSVMTLGHHMLLETT